MSNTLNNFFLELNNNLAVDSKKYINQLNADLSKLEINFNSLNVTIRETFQTEMRLIRELKDKLEEDNKNILLLYYHLIRLLNVINNLKLNYCIKNAINNYKEILKNLTKLESWTIGIIDNAIYLSQGKRNNQLISIAQFNQADWLASDIDIQKSIINTANTYCNFVKLMAVNEEVRGEVESIQLTRNGQAHDEKSEALIGKLSDSGNRIMSALEKDLVRLYFNSRYLPHDRVHAIQSKYQISISQRYVKKYTTLLAVLKNELNAKKYGRFRQFFSKKAYLSAQALIDSIDRKGVALQRKPAEYFNDLQNLLRQTNFLDKTLRNICAKYSKTIIDWLVNRNVFNAGILEDIVNIFLNTGLNSEQIDQFIPSLIANFTNLSPEQKMKAIWRLHLIESVRGKLTPELGSFILFAAREFDISKDFTFFVPAKNGELIEVCTNLKKLISQRNTYCYQVLQQPDQTIHFTEFLSLEENQRVNTDLCLNEHERNYDQEKIENFNLDKLNRLENEVLREIKVLNIDVDKLRPLTIKKITALISQQPQQLSSKIQNLLTCWHDALQLFELRENICKDKNEHLLWLLTRELTIDFIVASKVNIDEFRQNPKKTYRMAGRLISNLPLLFVDRFQSSKEFKCYSFEPSLNIMSFPKYLDAELIAGNIAGKLILWLGAAIKKIQTHDLYLFVKYIKEKIFLILSDRHEKFSGKIINFCLEKLTQPLNAQAQELILAKLSNDSKIKQFEELLCANQYQAWLTKNNQHLQEQIAEITAKNESLIQAIDQYRQQLAEKDKHLQLLNQKLDDEIQIRKRIQKEQQEQADSREHELREQLQQASQAATKLSVELDNVKSDLKAQKEKQEQTDSREHALESQLQEVNQAIAKLEANLVDVKSKLEIQMEQSINLGEELNHLKTRQTIISSKLFDLETNDVVQREQTSKLDKQVAALIKQKNKLDDELNDLKTQQKRISDALSRLQANNASQYEQSSKLSQEVSVLQTQQQQIADDTEKLKGQLKDQVQPQIASLGKEHEELRKTYDENNSYVAQQTQQTQQEIQSVKQQVEQFESFKKDFEQLKKNLLEANADASREHQVTQKEVSQNNKAEMSQSLMGEDKAEVKVPGYVHALREFIKVQQNFCRQIKILHQSLLVAKNECKKPEYIKYKKLSEILLRDKQISIYEILAKDVLNVADIKLEDITQKTFSYYIQTMREAMISSDFLVVRLANLHKAALYYERYFLPRNQRETTQAMTFFMFLDKSLKAQSEESMESNLAYPFQMCTRFKLMIENIYILYKENAEIEPGAQSALKRLNDFFAGYAKTVNDFNKSNTKIIQGDDNKKFDEMMQSLEKLYAQGTSVQQTPSGKIYPATIKSIMFQPAAPGENDSAIDTLKRVLNFGS